MVHDAAAAFAQMDEIRDLFLAYANPDTRLETIVKVLSCNEYVTEFEIVWGVLLTADPTLGPFPCAGGARRARALSANNETGVISVTIPIANSTVVDDLTAALGDITASLANLSFTVLAPLTVTESTITPINPAPTSSPTAALRCCFSRNLLFGMPAFRGACDPSC